MRSNQREILGIVFHMLRNWHSGFSGLVVGIVGECCAAITRVGSGSVPLRRGELRCIDWVRRKELFCANVCILMNIHYHTNLKNFETACGLPPWPWCLSLTLHFSTHIRLLAAAVAGLVSLHCDALCAKEDLDRGLLLLNRCRCQLFLIPGRVVSDPCEDLQQYLHLAVTTDWLCYTT